MTAGEIATFGGLLRRFRKAASLTQEELAERTGLSRRGVNGLERGAHQVPLEDAVALLADALSLAGDDRTAFFAAARRPVPVSAPVAAPAPVATPTAMPAQQVRSTLPGGTVTFLFTDIEGSTRLLQRLGSAYAAALGEEAWAAAFAAGRALSLEGAIAEALEIEPGHEQQSPHDDGRR
jgi:transcriptional regulator with XRE-family HTH domain